MIRRLSLDVLTKISVHLSDTEMLGFSLYENGR